MAATEEAEVTEVQEPPAQVDPSGRWTRTNDILGKGAFKTVYKGFDELEGLEVAWNQIRMNELVSTKEDRDRLFAEIRVLKQLKHKNIMTFHDSWLEKQGYTVNFITELFTSGTLRQYRKRHRFVDSEVMKRWAWQILCGLVYLHGHTPPIIHRDLKCDNIFINGSEGVVKIGDLGLATMLRARTAPQSVLGTPEFMAPELYDEQYDDRVDVYSFGMCLLELATLEYPYSECRNAAQIYRKVTLGIRPKALERVTNRGLAEFILHCIQPLETRPKSRQLLKHHYFNSIRAERLTVKLGAEALGLPVPKENESHPDLQDYANSGGSSSVSRTSSAAGEMHHDTSFILDAVPEEDDTASTSSKAGENGPGIGQGEVYAREQYRGNAPGPSPQQLPKSESMRDFKVKGKLQEDEDKLSLRLRILQDERAPKVVEFEFDLASDTAISVASEMVEEMSLSHEDAAVIAQAIKNEIFNLTHRSAAYPYPHPHHPGAASFGSASDDEAPHARGGRAPSESGMTGTSEVGAHESAATEVKFEASALLQGSNSACSDSVMSVHDAHDDPLSPQAPRPIATGGCSSPYLSTSLPMEGTGGLADTPMGGASMSLGGSPTGDPMLIDPPPPSGPFSSGLNNTTTSYPPQVPRPLTPSGLPPFANNIARTRSEGLLRRLSRTDSANQANEVEALQQALNQKGASRLLANLPKDEDRRLPLQKLLESMKEIQEEGGQQAASRPTSTSQSPSRSRGQLRVETAPGQLEPLSIGDRGQITPRAVSTPPPGGMRGASGRPDLRRMSLDTSSVQTSPVQASTSGRTLEGMAGHVGSHSASSSTWSTSPRQEPTGGGHAAHGAPQRSKSRAELAPEARELRLQAAQTALTNMESKSLLGLDDFGITRGCKQKQPIKSLMGLGKI